jgi:NADP-dependent 3-hydroxy acid dehydrogenase YdfG
VVTGATSGARRATAHAFAGHGARLLLVARDVAALDEVAAECHRARAVVVVAADVGRAVDVDRIVAEAVGRFGRLDTWVNVAGVLVAGLIGAETIDEIDRLVDTNVRGNAYGSRAAMTQFARQEGGVLINVSSVLGVLPNPLVPLYTMTKFAVRGLTLSLHHLSSAMPGVRVCVVMPGPIDSPMFEQAANHTGRRLRAVPPACAPERVAAAIVACARRPRRQVVVGFTGRFLMIAHRVSPRLTEWIVARAAATMLLRKEETEPTSGALFEPRGPSAMLGGWRKVAARRWLGGAFGRTLAGRGQ